jgi:hypothetical protein
MMKNAKVRLRESPFSFISWGMALLIIALCFSTSDSHAQRKDENRWRVGIMGGMNTTSLIGANAGFQKLGVIAGLVLHKPLGEQSAFETNLLFFQKGVRTVSNPEAGNFESYRLSLNYLDLPLLYVHKLKKFEIELGPSFGFLLSQNEEVFEGQPPESQPFKTFELAINTGLRWHPADNFILGLRYHLAMLPSQSVAPAGLATMRGRHNHGFVLFGTFLF